MSSLKELYDLQEIDLQLDKRRAELASLRGKLGETPELLAARAAVEQEDKALRPLTIEHKPLEMELQTLEEKIRSVEKQLYSGSVRSPKELMALEHDIASLKRRKESLEERILVLMDNIEAQQAKLRQATQELQAKTAQWQADQKRLQEEIDRAQAAVSTLTSQREKLWADVEPALLARYQTLRPAKHGVAVAKVERGLCQGCRIAVPSSDVQRARAGREIVACNSCGRILYVS